MQDFVDLVKALSDTSRLRALCALRDGELCVCQIIDLLELAPSTVSKHMSILRQARLVGNEKRGRWVYYRLLGENAPEMVTSTLKWVFDSIATSDEIELDSRRLSEILKNDPEVLCKK